MVKEWFLRLFSFFGHFEIHKSSIFDIIALNLRQDGPTRGLKRPRRETLKKNPKKLKEDPEEMIEEPIPEVEPLDSSLNESVESSSSDCRAEDNRWKKVSRHRMIVIL